MLSLLYDIFISPLMAGMNFVLISAYSMLNSYGLAIIVLSLVVNTVLLPLYNIADKWQQEERAKQQRMAEKVAEIKQAFKGQERFMMLKTLYRQHHYHPIMAVRNSVGFLIQVPFFFAAYQLLSHFPELNGQEFGPFSNLGVSDGLLAVGSLNINVMPFVMTAINLMSAFVYSKGLSSKDKVQLYLFAGLFLVLLYSSPVGLVLYWTLNNVYSLFKNILSKVYSRAKYNKGAIKLSIVIRELCSILVLYSILSLMLGQIMPSGVTKDFFLRSFPYYMIVPIFYVLLVLFRLIGRDENNFNKRRERNNFYDVSLVIIPFIPLSQYITSNIKYLSFGDVISHAVLILSLLTFLVILLPYMFSSLIAKKTLQSAFLTVICMIALMPTVSAVFNYASNGSLSILLPLLLLMVVFCYAVVRFNGKNVVILSFVVLLSNTVLVCLNSEKNDDYSNNHNVAKLPIFKSENNVYLLTYDAYVNNETMMEYGIDNKNQEDFLVNSGFTLYPDTYSIAAASTSTMGRVLNATSDKNGLMDAVAGDGMIFDIFRNNGYITAGYFENTYFFMGAKNNYDESYPQVAYVNPINMIYTSILSGYFRFDLGFDEFSRDDFLLNKYNYLSNINRNSFTYMHTGPGHSQNSGQCLINEIELFKERLDIANNEMARDIEAIEDNDPNAIIIINGDHGPYLTKNCFVLKGNYSSTEINRLDMQDRYGTFLAIKLPNGDIIDSTKINIIQDVFPEIFNYLTHSNDFDKLKLKTRTVEDVTSGVYIDDGVIYGGINDGEKLFLGEDHAK